MRIDERVRLCIILLLKIYYSERRSTCEWKTYSGRSNNFKLHTTATPSGSFIAIGFLLYEATQISGF